MHLNQSLPNCWNSQALPSNQICNGLRIISIPVKSGLLGQPVGPRLGKQMIPTTLSGTPNTAHHLLTLGSSQHCLWNTLLRTRRPVTVLLFKFQCSLLSFLPPAELSLITAPFPLPQSLLSRLSVFLSLVSKFFFFLLLCLDSFILPCV